MLVPQTLDIVDDFLSQNGKVLLSQFPDFLPEVIAISFQKFVHSFSDVRCVFFESLYSLKSEIYHFAHNNLLFASDQELHSVVYAEISIL